MTKEEVIEIFKEKPYLLAMGANKIAGQLKTDVNVIRECRSAIRRNIKKQDINHVNKNYNYNPKPKLPRILFLDIETSPLLCFVFQKQVWKARIGHDKVLSDWYILTYSYKWAGEDTIYSERLYGEEAEHEDDSRIVNKLWSVFCDADIVIAHNGDNFDVPNINSRFLINGLVPPTSYRQIDTLKVVQKQFGFTHNSLDALADLFGIPRKIETNFDLWKRCIFGSDEALIEMETYNRNDVDMLEQLYIKLRPWIKSHVNLSVYNDNVEEQCSHCGSHKIIQHGYSYTNTSKYENYRCLDCGAISRGRKNILSKNKKTLVSLPGR